MVRLARADLLTVSLSPMGRLAPTMATPALMISATGPVPSASIRTRRLGQPVVVVVIQIVTIQIHVMVQEPAS